jgi:hypothetical protein
MNATTSFPVFFDDPGRVNSLLNAVVAHLPSADIVMYRKLHHILLQVCKAFYSHGSDFLQRILEITVSRFNGPFGYISVDFWHSFCSFEFDLMTQNTEDEAMAKKVVLPCMNYAHQACDLLALLCLQVLDETVGEDPGQLPEETSIWMYAAPLLQDLHTVRPDVIGPRLFDFVAGRVVLDTWQEPGCFMWFMGTLRGRQPARTGPVFCVAFRLERVSHIRWSTARYERGCAACPQHEQGKVTLKRFDAVKTR